MTEEYVTLNVQGQKVTAKLFKPQGEAKKVAVLFLHGWTGRPNTHAAAFLAEQGYYALTLVFRGHEGSEGDIKTVTAGDSLADAEAAYDYLQQQLPAGVGIVAVGNSYGGYIATLLSTTRELEGLSLRVPATYPDANFSEPKWGRGHDDPAVATWRLTAVNPEENRAFRAVHNFKGEVQIIEAGLDAIVPHQAVQNYVAATDPARLEYHLMKDWPHSLSDHPQRNQEFKDILISWLTKLA